MKYLFEAAIASSLNASGAMMQHQAMRTRQRLNKRRPATAGGPTYLAAFTKMRVFNAQNARRIIGLLIICLVAASGYNLLRPYFDHHVRNGQTASEQISPWRQMLERPQPVVALMHLQPGMTALDLGSGVGLFTLPLAQAVGENGIVFATDSDAGTIKLLTRVLDSHGVKNVVPTVVRGSGFDPFYEGKQFDVVLAADVVAYLGHPNEQQIFLRKLGDSIKENGRLWVLRNRFDPDFDAAEFGDWSVARQALKFPGAQAALLDRLRPEVRAALNTEPTGREPCCALLLEDLNRMLEDPTLWPEIDGKFQPINSFLNPNHRDVREYLANEIEEAGGFTQKPPPKSVLFALRFLNRLIIQDLLYTVAYEKAFHQDEYATTRSFTDGFGKKKIRGMMTHPPDETVSIIENAGYQLVREYHVLTTHYIWEFRRATPNTKVAG